MLEFTPSVSRSAAADRADAFYSRYYEREPLVINRENPHYYGDLLALDTLDEIITATALTGEEA